MSLLPHAAVTEKDQGTSVKILLAGALIASMHVPKKLASKSDTDSHIKELDSGSPGGATMELEIRLSAAGRAEHAPLRPLFQPYPLSPKP